MLSRIWKFMAVVRSLQCERRIVVSREVFHVRPTDRCHSRGDQRDQILRNFATFAKIFKSLEFFWQLFSYLAKCGAYFCKFGTLFGLIFIVANSQTLNINLTIWSHWRWFTPRSTRRNSPPPSPTPSNLAPVSGVTRIDRALSFLRQLSLYERLLQQEQEHEVVKTKIRQKDLSGFLANDQRQRPTLIFSLLFKGWRFWLRNIKLLKCSLQSFFVVGDWTLGIFDNVLIGKWLRLLG